MIARLRAVYRNTAAVDGWQCSICNVKHFHERRPRRGFALLVAHKVARHRCLPEQAGSITMYDPNRGRFRWEYGAPSC